MAIVHFCDRCRREIPGKPYQLTSTDTMTNHQWPIDLCRPCHMLFRDWMKAAQDSQPPQAMA